MSTFFPYTPRLETSEGLRACFVARQHLLNELLQSVREQSQEKNLQHWMIIGSRGLGKSHLIALLYHSVKQDTELAERWVPLLMKEEEQGVFSLHTLFTRILTVLAEEVEPYYPERARELDSYLGDLKKGKLAKEDILDGVLACIKDFTTATKRRLLVLVENTDDLLTRCLPKTNEIKQLRKILQHDNHILLIATSPGQFGRISFRKAPLYQFFRIRSLELLSFEQALELLNCWSKMDPDQKESEPFRRDDTKLRVLYHLTGGNPRILLFLYLAISGQGGIQRAVDTFSKLLEQDLSNYYLGRMRELTNQEQPIVIALAEADQSNLTQKEIARHTFLPQASMGTAMMRLESQGIVRAVSGKKGKNTLYTLTDHLFRLWYRWRTGVRERKVIEALVEFLGIWYRRKELQAWSGEKGNIGLYCREALEFRASERFRKYMEPFKMEAESALKEKLSHRDYGGFFDTLSLLREWEGEGGLDYLGPVLKGISKGPDLDQAIDYLTGKLNQEPDSLDAWMDAGVLLERKGDLAGAEQAFAKAVELDPKYARGWFKLGVARHKQENFAGSEQAFERAAGLIPKNAMAWFNLGAARWDKGNYAGSEQPFEKAAEVDPKDAKTWFMLGLARDKLENHAGAEQAFVKAVDLDAKNAMAWFKLGEARWNQKNYAGSEQAVEKVVQLDPKDPGAWFNLGLARANQKNHASSEQAFERGLQLDPTDARAWLNLGTARANQKNYAGAEQALEKVVELDPKSARGWFRLGLARSEQKNHPGAELAFTEAVGLNPRDAHAWFHVGLACVEQGNDAGAEQAFAKIVELDPKHAKTWLHLGFIRRKREHHAEAEQAFAKAVELDPKDAVSWFCLGVAREAQKNHEGAELAFERATELDPKDAAAWFNLGVARWNQSNHEGAEQAVERAVELDPKDANSWLKLGTARARRGDQAGAEQAIESALALDPSNSSTWNGLVILKSQNYSFNEAWEACIRAIELGVKERSAYANLVELYLTTEVGNPLFVLDRALQTQEVESGVLAWVSLLRAMVSLSMGDRTPFMKDLKWAADILQSMVEEQRAEIVGELMDFLIGVTYCHTLERVEAYLAGLSRSVPSAASILIPLGFVIDYFKVYFSEAHKKGPVGKQPEQVLDRVPSELRAPVDDMVRRVKEQQAWWDRRPKKSDGKE